MAPRLLQTTLPLRASRHLNLNLHVAQTTQREPRHLRIAHGLKQRMKDLSRHLRRQRMDDMPEVITVDHDVGLGGGEEFKAKIPDNVYQSQGDIISAPQEEIPVNPYAACLREVTAVFPDICPIFLKDQAFLNDFAPDAIIHAIVDLAETGKSYTKRRKTNNLKRKRDDEDDSDAEITLALRKYADPNRARVLLSYADIAKMKRMLAGDFPYITIKNIYETMKAHHNFMLPTYLALYEQMCKSKAPVKKTPSQQDTDYAPENLASTIEDCRDPTETDFLKEFQIARRIRESRDKKKQDEVDEQNAEQRNLEGAQARGEVMDCGCCYVEAALNRMVHCDNDVAHWFCRDCARRNAENIVGLSKYQLTCMSTESCTAGFSFTERGKFLDSKLTSALDRIEQEAVLRLAQLENLVSCPFCPYAAECPPVEVDREFRCENPECQIVSCRLCKAETHIPRTCEEAALENGISARRQIEEAMSAAMIRKCNKCHTPFIKENGCNKMTCTRQGCHNIQCYVCSQSCDYSHFNDASRGGRAGNCPLFDSVEARHEEEVRRAEEATRTLIAEKNPELNPELLGFKMSSKVSKDDEKRRQEDPFVNQGQLYMRGLPVGPGLPAEGQPIGERLGQLGVHRQDPDYVYYPGPGPGIAPQLPRLHRGPFPQLPQMGPLLPQVGLLPHQIGLHFQQALPREAPNPIEDVAPLPIGLWDGAHVGGFLGIPDMDVPLAHEQPHAVQELQKVEMMRQDHRRARREEAAPPMGPDLQMLRRDVQAEAQAQAFEQGIQQIQQIEQEIHEHVQRRMQQVQEQQNRPGQQAQAQAYEAINACIERARHASRERELLHARDERNLEYERVRPEHQGQALPQWVQQAHDEEGGGLFQQAQQIFQARQPQPHQQQQQQQQPKQAKQARRAQMVPPEANANMQNHREEFAQPEAAVERRGQIQRPDGQWNWGPWPLLPLPQNLSRRLRDRQPPELLGPIGEPFNMGQPFGLHGRLGLEQPQQQPNQPLVARPGGFLRNQGVGGRGINAPGGSLVRE